MSKEKITLPGIVLSAQEAKEISNGARTQVVKSEQYLKYIGKLIFVVCDGKAYSTIKMKAPKAKTLAQFDKLFEKHGISKDERKERWPRKKKLFVYDVVLIEDFDNPVDLECDADSRIFIKSASFIVHEEIAEEVEETEIEETKAEKAVSKTVLPKQKPKPKAKAKDIKPITETDRFEREFTSRRSISAESEALGRDVRRLDDYLEDDPFQPVSQDVLDVLAEEMDGTSSEDHGGRERFIPPSSPPSKNTLTSQVKRMRALSKEKTKPSNGQRVETKEPAKKSGDSIDISSTFSKLLKRLS